MVIAPQALPNLNMALFQMKVEPGQPRHNANQLIEAIHQAKREGAHYIAAPEMSVPGYLLGDEWDVEAFGKEIHRQNMRVVDATDGITASFGTLTTNLRHVNRDGRGRKYNSVIVARDGQILDTVHKTLLPTYRQFDDSRYFFSANDLAAELGITLEQLLNPVEIPDADGNPLKLGIVICEDIWSGDYKSFIVPPAEILARKGARFLVNHSCSPWGVRKDDKRWRVISETCQTTGLGMAYINCVGAQNNGKNMYLLDGGSAVHLANGEMAWHAKRFENRVNVMDLSQLQQIPRPVVSEEQDYRDIYESLGVGIREYFTNNAKGMNAVIGLSGGRDSALTSFLCKRFLGEDRTFTVNMPAKFSSDETISVAECIAKLLGVYYMSYSIQPAVDLTMKELHVAKFRHPITGHEISLNVTDLVQQNVQARDRFARVLDAIASAINGVVINNGNKSEGPTGYFTVDGDGRGGLAPLGDMYKSKVEKMLHYINKWEREAGRPEPFPKEMFEIPPSAELSAEHDVKKSKGDPFHYPYHDKILEQFIEFRKYPEDILERYYNGTLLADFGVDTDADRAEIARFWTDDASFVTDLERMWILFKGNFWKRVQSQTNIAITRRALGFDLRESMLPYTIAGTENYRELLEARGLAGQSRLLRE